MVVIVLFAVLTCISVAMGDSGDSQSFTIISLILLAVFLVELLLKLYSMGLVSAKQMFLRTLWNTFDLAVVLLSLILCIITLAENDQGLGYLKFSAVLRLLRLIVAVRKLGDFQRINAKLHIQVHKDYSIDVASERVMEILTGLLTHPWVTCDLALARDIHWCRDIISSDRLHEARVTVGRADTGLEHAILDIVNNFSKATTGSANYPRRRSSIQVNPPVKLSAEQEITLEVKQCLRTLDLNDFDVFELKRITNGKELFTLMDILFKRSNLFSLLNVNEKRFTDFVSRIETGYNPVPYHTATHAADVVQTLHYFLTSCSAGDLLQITPVETAACYLAACVHDFEHPGVNNTYLVNTQSELALRYNDKSVLENHHVSSSFCVSLNEDFDFYSDLSPADFARLRTIMIEMVLSTDIVQHFSLMSMFKSKFPSPKEICSEDKTLCFQVLIHAADISNPSKSWDLCLHWTELVMQEFWVQGDRERAQGLPLGFLMDRFTVNVAKSQVNFIDVIVSPTFETLRVEFPALVENCGQLSDNKAKWTKRIPKYEQELEQLKNSPSSPRSP